MIFIFRANFIVFQKFQALPFFLNVIKYRLVNHNLKVLKRSLINKHNDLNGEYAISVSIGLRRKKNSQRSILIQMKPIRFALTRNVCK